MIPHTANYAPLVFSHIMIPIETLLFIFLRPYEVHDEISIDYINTPYGSNKNGIPVQTASRLLFVSGRTLSLFGRHHVG